MLKVQIINKGHQPLPAFATPQSVGMDLRANIIRLSCFILWSVDSFLRDFFGTETWANFLSNGYFEKKLDRTNKQVSNTKYQYFQYG